MGKMGLGYGQVCEQAMYEYEKLTTQPLVIALVEFRFSVVLKMQDHIESFQDCVRDQFPIFTKRQTQTMHFSPNGVQVDTSLGWVFQTSNKKSALMLDTDRLVLITSEYGRFPDFFTQCEKALTFIADEIKPALLQRIGLRYSDAIIAKDENENIQSYVQPEVCNVEHVADIGQQIHRINETVLQTDVGILAIKSLYGKLNLSTWHDLSDTPVTIKQYPAHSERILLDFDHYWQPSESEDSVAFDVDFMRTKTASLHEKSREAFWRMTTELGRRQWR